MSLSFSKSLQALVALALFSIAAVSGSADVSASRNVVDSCPDGWRLVTPPLNPVRICLPDTIVLDDGSGPDEAPPEAFCPDGWTRVTPPLNPALGCLPDTIVAPEPSREVMLNARIARKGDATCPDGFRPATHPLNFVLGCLPDSFHLEPGTGDSAAPTIPPGSCPAGWRQVTRPLNPLLICLPDSFKFEPTRER